MSHASLRFYAHQYCPAGTPVIPRLIHRWLTPPTLAHWYMHAGRRCPGTGGIILAASGYSAKEIELVVRALRARTMDCARVKGRKGAREGEGEGGGGGRGRGDSIRFVGPSAVFVWKTMQPFVLPEMRAELEPRVRVEGARKKDKPAVPAAAVQ